MVKPFSDANTSQEMGESQSHSRASSEIPDNSGGRANNRDKATPRQSVQLEMLRLYVKQLEGMLLDIQA